MRKTEENSRWTCHKDKEQADEDGRHQHGSHVRRTSQQTQEENHEQLTEPGHAVEEFENLPLFGKLGRIADDNGGHIQGQQAIAAHQGTEAVGKESQAEHQYTHQGAGLELQAGQQPVGKAAHQITNQEAHGQLVHQNKHDGQSTGPLGEVEDIDIGALDNIYQNDGARIGHRVITTGFQLQHGAQMFPQLQSLTAKDGEHGRGICRGEHSGHQQSPRQGHSDTADGLPHKEINETAREKDGEKHAHRRQQGALPEHRTGFVHFRFQTARKQNHRHAKVADEFRQMQVMELQAHSVGAGQHTDDKEHQHGRHTELGADLIGKNGHKYQDGEQQEQIACI